VEGYIFSIGKAKERRNNESRNLTKRREEIMEKHDK